MKTAVIGAGSWGTALSIVLGRNGHDVRLLGRSEDQVDLICQSRVNERYLPGCPLPETVTCGLITDPPQDVDFVVAAVPSSVMHHVIDVFEPYENVLVASKGLDPDGRVLTEMFEGKNVGAFSGPNLAAELAKGIPTAAVVASPCEETAIMMRGAFMSPGFRVYITDDMRGVELAGALKNVISLGAGISDGLGFGNNTKGALLSRGLSEIARLGMAMGARLETFLGVAGVGDLFATAASTLSRNYRVGRSLGEGKSLQTALDEIGQVAEGVPTCRSAVLLAAEHDIEVTIINAIRRIIDEEIKPQEAVSHLMGRSTLQEGLGYAFSVVEE